MDGERCETVGDGAGEREKKGGDFVGRSRSSSAAQQHQNPEGE